MKLPFNLKGHHRLWNSVSKNLKVLFTTSLALVLVFCLGCSPNISDAIQQQTGQNANSSGEIHVAFAGGGWRAHSGHAAWVMSLLHANQSNCALSGSAGNPACLTSALTNVKTISGNSGGSWFSTMLMYDEDFINQITNTNATSQWGLYNPRDPDGGGWLGRQRTYFQGFKDCHRLTGDDYIACWLGGYYNSCDNTLVPDWSLVTSELVYKGYNWQSYGNLNTNTRQPWAKDKSLLMAATLVTNSVVLNDNGDSKDEIYYQVCDYNNTVKLDKHHGGSCLDASGNTVAMPDVVPVSFTSLAESSPSLKAPTFYSARTPSYNLGYSVAYDLGKAPTRTSLPVSKFNTMANDVPVLWAAASSSAATGYTASHKVTKAKCSAWDCAYHARNLGLSFKFPNYGNGEIMYTSGSAMDVMSLDELNNQRLLKLADGGVVDNSGIAQLISYLQLNTMADGFNIVAFDDVQYNDARDTTKYPSSDIGYLFTSPKDNKITFQGFTIRVPPLAILKEDPASAQPITQYTWTVVDGSGTRTQNKLHYYIYKVETIPNGNFSINGSSKGTIHVFSSEFGCATTAPENNNNFDCYDSMIQNFPTTLANLPDGQTTGKTGLELLREAFGL